MTPRTVTLTEAEAAAAGLGGRPQRANKYGARGAWLCLWCGAPAQRGQSCPCGGPVERFDSQAEARRFGELKRLERQGEIAGLVAHPVFPLFVNGQHVADYVADAAYHVVLPDGTLAAVTVEDTKGGQATKTRTYRLKRKLMAALHGIDVHEVG